MTQTKFIHCRNRNEDNSISPKGGLTVAYCMDDNYKVIAWAAAKCHEKDTYNKKVGRMKASGRLKSKTYFQECPPTDEIKFIQQTHDGFSLEFAT